ncbi:thiamine pyrophosphokinase [Moniliophthora roreri]|uniref:CS domain-containing protein n=1 Tax=Moniliophthora roreri TaxID=221103 RepID=A0A0W0FRP7_MONRR|nr:thiamine pyrophosphokinase [Moniliophthora roreri]
MPTDSSYEWRYSPYSWHQSHDQATVLLKVPYHATEEDISVTIERNYIIAGIVGQAPIVKGRLYGNVDIANSLWLLEPRTSRLSARERTTSTASTTSTQSSYALVSDPEISSSFAASLDSGHTSDVDELSSPSPALSSPSISSADEFRGFTFQKKTHSNAASSRPLSPGAPSFSSLDSLNGSHTERLLTLHLVKENPVIWPNLVSGPVPISISPFVYNSVIFDASHELEHKYNCDPTSLTHIALELLDVRQDKEEAFEYFLRAWHFARAPTATMKLVSYYLPMHVSYNLHSHKAQNPVRGSTAYYVQCMGGAKGLAQLYLEAGMLYLEGSASSLVSSSHSTLSLSSIRMPLQSQPIDTGTQAWRRDRVAASRFFERARVLHPELDIPAMPPPAELNVGDDLEMPCIELNSGHAISRTKDTVRRRRKEEPNVLLGKQSAKIEEDIDNTWYMFIPTLVGAGTALVVVGVVGVLSFSSWSRRNQGS